MDGNNMKTEQLPTAQYNFCSFTQKEKNDLLYYHCVMFSALYWDHHATTTRHRHLLLS